MGRFHSISANRRRSGFSLIEIMIVIAIVLVLIAIALPLLRKARETSHATRCMHNIRQVGQVILLYGTENNGELLSAIVYDDGSGATGKPWSYHLNETGYLPADSYNDDWNGVMTCPSRETPARVTYNRQHYGMSQFPGFTNTRTKVQSPRKLANIANPQTTMILTETRNWYMVYSSDRFGYALFPHGGKSNVVFFDGHVETVEGPYTQIPTGTNTFPFY